MRSRRILNDVAYMAAFLDVFRVLENPGAVLRAKLGRPTVLRFKSGLRLRVASAPSGVTWPDASALLSLAFFGAELVEPEASRETAWVVDQMRKTVTTPEDLVFTLDSVTSDPGIFRETFVQHIHFETAHLDGLIVVDAGSFVGDSALYFAHLGAEVFAFEPDPTNYARLLRNLELNSCGSRVHPFRQAVGIDGTIPFHIGARGGSQGYMSREEANATVESVSLETIVAGLPGEPFLLKADIKGAEYEIVRQPAIRRFQRLAIEYNGRPGGGLPLLLRTLRDQGFEGVVSNPFLSKHPLSHLGILRMDRPRAGTPGARGPA